ncbi:hypothetical protein V8E51_008413 [Hyaloscypha variabilis]
MPQPHQASDVKHSQLPFNPVVIIRWVYVCDVFSFLVMRPCFLQLYTFFLPVSSITSAFLTCVVSPFVKWQRNILGITASARILRM